jgi:hypothetical protein
MFAFCPCENRWVWELFRKIGLLTSTGLGVLNFFEVEDCVSDACTLRRTSKKRVGDCIGYGTGNIVKLLSANDMRVFKIVTLWAYLEIVKLKFS